MRAVIIKTGVYGRRTENGRVSPVAKGEQVTLSDEEAARLVALDVAFYAESSAVIIDAPPANASDMPPVPPADGEEPPTPQDTTDEEPPTEPPVSGGDGDVDAAEVARLERMQRPDLEHMAADQGIDLAAISSAKNKHDLAVLIVAAGESDDGDAPPDITMGDIIQ